VVDIGRVRLVANVVEKDLSQLQTGDSTQVEVDAFPGETFTGRIARVAPVLDPATRTASIEIEIPNPKYRLRPGMYARVTIVTDTTKDALVLPSDAIVDLGGRRGVFVPQDETAVFRMVQVGAEQGNKSEVLAGLVEGDTVITTGARALRDGDRVVLPGAAGGRGRGGAGTATADPARTSDAPAGESPSGPATRRGGGVEGAAGTTQGAPSSGGRGRRSGGSNGG
jgi:HlyD family secretion protein